MSDMTMVEFLNHVITSDQYLDEVKQPSNEIKKMIEKRIAFAQEIKVRKFDLEIGN